MWLFFYPWNKRKSSLPRPSAASASGLAVAFWVCRKQHGSHFGTSIYEKHKKSKPGSGRMTQCYGSEILLQWSTPHLFQTFPIFVAGIWKLTLRDANLEDDNVRVDSSGGGSCGKSLQDGTARSQLLFVFSVSNGISEANSPKCPKNLGWKPYKLRFPASGLRGNVVFTPGRIGLLVSLSAAIAPLLPSLQATAAAGRWTETFAATLLQPPTPHPVVCCCSWWRRMLLQVCNPLLTFMTKKKTTVWSHYFLEGLHSQ